MKAKVITGILGGAFAITMVALMFTPVFSIAVAAFTTLANYELLKATGVTNKGIFVLTTIPATAMPFILDYDLIRFLPVPVVVPFLLYTFILLMMMLKSYEHTRFEHVSMALVSSLLVPYVMSLMLEIRDFFPEYPRSTRGYLLVFTLVCAWITDVMAYFVGVKLGKHKMSPKISPKKSWEGAVGGVIGTVIINFIVYGVYYALYRFGLIEKILFRVCDQAQLRRQRLRDNHGRRQRRRDGSL